MAAVDAEAISGEDDDFTFWAAYCKAKKKRVKRKGEDGGVKQDTANVKGGGQTLHGIKRHTGLRNRRFRRGSEYHLVQMCPLEAAPETDSAPTPPVPS